jgi:hypothetical protein
MSEKQILITLGGTDHDFDGFCQWMVPVLEAAGHSVEATYDLDALTQLDAGTFDLVVLYTCLATPTEEQPKPMVHTEE